jgi:Fe-S cluster biogenesis protein NfuA
MTIRTDEEIITQIKELIETQVKPAVAGHGGVIEFISYNEGTLLVACSGCASSSITLKLGVEQMVMHYVPEVTKLESQDDQNSTIDPYYSQSQFDEPWDYDDNGV